MGQESFLSEQIIGLSESIDDRVAALLVAGTGITLTYNDGAGTLTIAASSTGIGGSTGSADNAVLRADGTGGATLQTSAFVIADIATASPNNTVNHASIQATGATTNVSVSIVPKGTGAFMLAVPDGTATGGNVRGANAIDLQLTRSAANQVASGVTDIAIGASNRVSSEQTGIAIGASNSSLGKGPTIAIGRYCVAGDGTQFACYIAIGSSSNSTAFFGTAIGEWCNATGIAGVAIGRGNTASGTRSSALGYGSTASRYGQESYAAGVYSSDGDLQRVRFSMLGRTTDATPVNLALELPSTRLTLTAGRVLILMVTVSGHRSDGAQHAIYTRRVAIKRVGSNTTLIQSQVIGTDYEDNAACDVSITADDVNEALQVQVTGIAGETWRWEANLIGSELTIGT